MYQLKVGVAETLCAKGPLLLLVLEFGEDKIINRTALRKDVRLQVLEDAIVDFDLVDGQFVCYGCGRL